MFVRKGRMLCRRAHIRLLCNVPPLRYTCLGPFICLQGRMHRREKNTCLIVVRKSVVADTASTTFFKEHTAWTAGVSRI